MNSFIRCFLPQSPQHLFVPLLPALTQSQSVTVSWPHLPCFLGNTPTVPERRDGVADGQDAPVHRQRVHQDRAHVDGAPRRRGDLGRGPHHSQHNKHRPRRVHSCVQRDVPSAQPAAELCGPQPEQPQRPQRGTHLAPAEPGGDPRPSTLSRGHTHTERWRRWRWGKAGEWRQVERGFCSDQ